MIPCTKCYWYRRDRSYIKGFEVITPDYCTNFEYINPVDMSMLSAKEARVIAGRECKHAEYRGNLFNCAHKWTVKRFFIFWKVATCKKCMEVCK